MKTPIKNLFLLTALIGGFGLMLAASAARAAAHFQRLKSFGFADQMGQNPYAPLMQGSNGVLYGTTFNGGSKNAGTVFRANKDGNGYQVLHHFDGVGEGFPTDGLLEGSDGALYGTTRRNFANPTNYGSVFKLNKDGSGYAVLRRFTSAGGDGQLPRSVLEGGDGALYGTTAIGGSTNGGIVFRLNKDGSGYVVLRNFGLFPGDGRSPQAGLLQGSDGTLYATTSSGGNTNAGTVFKLNKDGSGYAILWSFGGSAAGDGQRPQGILVQGSDGMLYGITERGGTNSAGNVFRLNTDGTAYQIVHIFDGSDGSSPVGLTEGKDGALYGAASSGGPPGFYNGTLFKLNKDGTGFNVLHSFGSISGDGLNPYAGVVQGSDGALYGTTYGGGIQGQGGSLGTLFTLNTNGSSYRTLRAFNDSGGDGSHPYGLVEATNGILYGTTGYGGSSSLGTIYQLNKNGSGYAILHSFSTNGGDGYYPGAALLPASDGALYGTTYGGGDANWGTVFKLNLDGSDYGTLRRFSATSGDASGPEAALVEGSNGVLYGTSYYADGYQSGDGTVFKLNKDGTGYSTLYLFNSSAGGAYIPDSPLVRASDGALYGTTEGGGGSFAFGSVFTLNLDGSGYAILHGFDARSGEGVGPGGLMEGSDGALYGVTDINSKEPANGTVFTLNKDGSGFAILHSFGGAPGDGALPSGGLVEGGDGALYGATQSGGSSNRGTLFRLNKDGTGYRVLYNFAGTGADGKIPVGALVIGSDGAFYGTTSFGGDPNFGTVFRWLPPETPDMVGVSLAGGSAQVTFGGTTGQHYRLLRSTDLKTWSELTTTTMPAEEVYTHADAFPPSRAAFYRAAWIP